MKKVFKTVLAASLAFGSAAVVPAGGIGLLSGPQTAKAAATLPDEAAVWLASLQEMYDQYLSASDRTDIQAARSLMLADSANGANQVGLLTEFLNEHSGGPVFTDSEVAAVLWGIVDALSFTDASGMEANLHQLRLDPTVRDFFDKLLQPSQIELDGQDGLDPADAAAFLAAFRTAVLEAVDPYDALSYLAGKQSGDALAELKSRLKDDLQAAFASVLERQDLLLSQALAAYADDDAEQAELAEAMARTMLILADAYDPDLHAVRALVKGSVLQEGVEYSGEVSNNGRKLTPTLTILGKAVPSSLLKWSVDSSDGMISVDGSAFVLSSSAAANTEYTATAKAEDFFFGIVLWEGDIAMKYVPSASGPVFVPTPEPALVAPPQSETLQKIGELDGSIRDKVQQLQNAPATERSNLIKQAIKEARAVLKQISTMTLSAPLSPSNGKATVTMDDATVAKIKEQIQAIIEHADAVNRMLQQLDPEASVKPVLNFDLGTVDADVEVPLVKEVLDAAAAAGIEISVTVNGASIMVDPSEFNDDTTYTISRVDRSEAESRTNNKVVSDVFDFSFTSGGEEVDQFDKTVQIGIPVPQPGEDDYDHDFLTVGKLVEGSIEIYGGSYSSETGNYSARRHSLSAYTVIENRVEFNDTSSVDAWAGRPIRSIAAKGIVEGRGAGAFDPGANITRAEFAKMIANALGIAGGSATESFDDVTDSDWFQPYVAAVQKWGITNGRHSASTFAPHENITRAEMATMIARALQTIEGLRSFADVEETLAQFADGASIHSTLQAGVAFSADYGIVLGKPDGTFDPNSYATRAEAAVMIYRLLNLE